MALSIGSGISIGAGLALGSDLPTQLGQFIYGGFYAGKISIDQTGVATHYLILASKEYEIFNQWSTASVITGINNIIDGPGNTTALVALGPAYEAGFYCGMTCNVVAGGINGYTDWYMPAKCEVEVLYYNLKPTTEINSVLYGDNPYAVLPEPFNTTYTTGNPAQTVSKVFQVGQYQALGDTVSYWTSTEPDLVSLEAENAWYQYMPSGSQFFGTKQGTWNCTRPVRRVPVVPTVIGQPFGGGFYAGQIAVGGGGVATHYLVIADKTLGETTGLQWGPAFVTTNVTSVIDGPTNSAALAALGATYQAATFCEGLTINGYTDWYLPAKNELEVIYYNLKYGPQLNYTGAGSNANAVAPEPISTNYSSTSPQQTSAVEFRTGGSQAITGQYNYWSSTENSFFLAASLVPYDGQFGGFFKTGTTGYYTRAIRRVPIV
jgi:hypothetical protein